VTRDISLSLAPKRDAAFLHKKAFFQKRLTDKTATSMPKKSMRRVGAGQ
jgi:hypothetical protein